jgi:phage repressor protein C with HTH and peptisase S24 domain
MGSESTEDVIDASSDRDLIEALCASTGLTASDVARKAGLAVSTLTRPLNHPVKHRLSGTTLNKLRQTFPDFAWFRLTSDIPPEDYDRDYVRIEVLPSFAGMGGGGSGEGDPETGMISRRIVEEELRAKPSDLLLIDVRGDSMEPDFYHGDQILVDKRDRDPRQPGPFALWDGSGYVVKLVERIAHQRGFYRIFSANGRYANYEVSAEDITIMGRPVWFARRL